MLVDGASEIEVATVDDDGIRSSVGLARNVTNATSCNRPTNSWWMIAQYEYSDRLFWSVRRRMQLAAQRFINDEEVKRSGARFPD